MHIQKGMYGVVDLGKDTASFPKNAYMGILYNALLNENRLVKNNNITDIKTLQNLQKDKEEGKNVLIY